MVVAEEERYGWLMPDQVPKERTDADLVRRAQADPEAFVDLYSRYVDTVFRYCNRRLSGAAAEDATSITFLNALRAIRGFDLDRSGFRPWLFTIAHNAVVDQLRARPHDPIDGVDVIEEGTSPDDHVIANERRLL